MLNIPELEKRWLHYKIKSYIPYAVIVGSIFIISIITIVFISKGTSTSNEIPVVKKQTIVQKKEPIEVVTEVNSPIVKQIEVKKELKVTQPTRIVPQTSTQYTDQNTKELKPSFDFMKKMQNATQPYYQNNTQSSGKNSFPRFRDEPVVEEKQDIVVQEIEVPKVAVVKEEPNKIRIKRQNTQNDIYEIIKRFKTNQNPALSLFVAKKYYELEDYENAYNYALITNNLNKEIESSWLIFAKSLVKLGKKEMAMKTLKEYIKHSHSSNAKMLLNDINSGKFR